MKLLLFALGASAQDSVSRVFKVLPGDPISAITTQFNPALTNQGGTTNAAGTFDVSPLAIFTSYEFRGAQQTSTFVLSGAPNVATAGQQQTTSPAATATSFTTIVADSGSVSGSASGSKSLASSNDPFVGLGTSSAENAAVKNGLSSSICAALAVVVIVV